MGRMGKMGRLANQLFEVASTYGLALKTDREVFLPEWSYQPYFYHKITIGERPPKETDINEPHFHYCGDFYEQILNGDSPIVSIAGYFQSEKYFEHCKDEIKNIFSFRQEMREHLYKKNKTAFSKAVIGIHIRRGDYVGNPNYYQLPITYYMLALEHEFPNWEQEYNVLIFSDDIPFCKAHFDIDGVYFSERSSDIEDMCLLSMCQHFILSNSSYSWWGAWLGETPDTKVIIPNYMFDGELYKSHNIKDFWPKRWKKFDHYKKKFDLSNAVFTIPVHYDHPDRMDNVKRVMKYLRQNFDTNIIIGEQGSEQFKTMTQMGAEYVSYPNMKVFHRTKMLNDMMMMSKASVIFNYDADIIIPQLQLIQAYKMAQSNCMVFPYDGRFGRIPKHMHDLPIEQLYTKELMGARKCDPISVGGCVAVNKKLYIEAGMENENFISYGPEDTERTVRVQKLGHRILRTKGMLYHYDHYIGNNSSGKNPYFGRNNNELNKIQALSKEQLEKEINKWKWRSEAIDKVNK
jgi:hypothetical protein